LNELISHPDLAPIVNSSKHIYSSTLSAVNDSAAEYVVQTIKHFFDSVIVVQYSITNTLEDQILSDVKLQVTNVESAYGLSIFKIANLQPGQ
jgi:coatomer protein complex subunit gamma